MELGDTVQSEGEGGVYGADELDLLNSATSLGGSRRADLTPGAIPAAREWYIRLRVSGVDQQVLAIDDAPSLQKILHSA
jgi:hypothetical protein